MKVQTEDVSGELFRAFSLTVSCQAHSKLVLVLRKVRPSFQLSEGQRGTYLEYHLRFSYFETIWKLNLAGVQTDATFRVTIDRQHSAQLSLRSSRRHDICRAWVGVESLLYLCLHALSYCMYLDHVCTLQQALR